MGKVDSEGKIDGVLYRKINRNLSLKLLGSYKSSDIKNGVNLADIEISNKNYTSVIRIGEGYFGFNWMQRIS
jgi:hypothetical protein